MPRFVLRLSINIILHEASRGEGAQACDSKSNKLLGSIPTQGNEIFNTLISFCNRIRRKIENGNILMGTECINSRFPLPTIYVQDTV